MFSRDALFAQSSGLLLEAKITLLAKSSLQKQHHLLGEEAASQGAKEREGFKEGQNKSVFARQTLVSLPFTCGFWL